MTDIFAAPSPAPDPTVALIAQDDLHLLAAVGRARITSWLLQIGYAQRTELARHVSLLQLLQMLLLQLACSVRGVSSACCSPWPSPVVPRHRYPSHRRPRRPPPAKCRGNEVGAKMTGSSSDFSSRTCASTAVPRKLAFGACSRGSVCAWATTTSSTPRAATKRKTRKC